MKRFAKTFASLITALLLLVTGVNTALDHVASSPEQGSFVFFSEKGRPVYVYNGNLSLCKGLSRPIVFRAGVTPRA